MSNTPTHKEKLQAFSEHQTEKVWLLRRRGFTVDEIVRKLSLSRKRVVAILERTVSKVRARPVEECNDYIQGKEEPEENQSTQETILPELAKGPRAEFEDPVPVEGDYFRWLRSIEPESLRRAWLDGDFFALQGSYFRMFRPHGPLAGEPPEARHVFDAEPLNYRGEPNQYYVQMEPWWHTWMSLDWGYIHPSVALYHKKSPEGRIYTFRELALNRIEPFELGVMIARDAKTFLEGLESKHMNVFLSPDAYDKRESEDTVASQLAAGVISVLGPQSAFLMDLDEAERMMKAEDALSSMLQRREQQRNTRLTFIRANNNRVAGWMHMQTLLRFTPLEPESVPDKEYASRLFEERGIVAQMEYLNLPEFSKPKEVLPKWKVSTACPLVIKCMPMAMHRPSTNDVNKWDATESTIGDDSIDSLRYGLLSEERQQVSQTPFHIRIEERLKAITGPGYSAHSQFMARRMAEYYESGRAKEDTSFVGHNRLEVQRAMVKQRSQELSRQMMARRVN